METTIKKAYITIYNTTYYYSSQGKSIIDILNQNKSDFSNFINRINNNPNDSTTENKITDLEVSNISIREDV